MRVRSIGGIGPTEGACYRRRWLIKRAEHEWGKWFHQASEGPTEWVRLCKRCPYVDYGVSE